jgi:hypothetical protein
MPLLVGIAAGQTAQLNGTIRSMTSISVKPERAGDFQAAVKEYVALLKKGGPDWSYTVWRSATGPGTFLLTRFYTKWAELDNGPDPKLKELAPQIASVSARINACVERGETVISEVLNDQSLPRTNDPPKMLQVMRTRVRRDRVDDYLELLKTTVFPAVKKAELKAYGVSRVRYGAPNSEIIAVTGLNGFADLDSVSPLRKAMSDEAFKSFVAKVRGMVEETTVDLYRFSPDLSYLAGK